MTKRKFSKIAAAAITVTGAALVATVIPPALAQNLPDGNGKETVEMVCTACHDLSPITDSGFSRDDWELVVKNMIDMGAAIKPEQVSVIANYLAANFPPKPKQ
jgi:virginiamycin B lyase